MNLTFSRHCLSLFLVILLGAVLLLAACSPDQTAPGTASPIRDKEARQLMDQLSGSDEEIAQAALERVLEAKDSRYVSIFIEPMLDRARSIATTRTPVSSLPALVVLARNITGTSVTGASAIPEIPEPPSTTSRLIAG